LGVQRKHANELCNHRRNVTAATALILVRVFGNSPDFWLNVQRRINLWEAMNNPSSVSGSRAPVRTRAWRGRLRLAGGTTATKKPDQAVPDPAFVSQST
jgi:plasmid maintenance system antidote protein VapI